jgi:SSS family solute:Na+ symporter
MHPGLLALIGLFFAWMLFIGYRTWRGHNKTELRENFLIGNRNVSAWLVAIGITMGWFDATQFGFTTAIAFDDPWSGLMYLASGSGTFLFLFFFAAAIRHNAAKNGAYMIGNSFSKIFSPRCGVMVGLCTATYLLIWLSMQFSVGSSVLTAFTGLPAVLAMAVLALVTLGYLLMGGFLASIRTDLALFGFFLLLLVIGAFILVPGLPGWLPSPRTLATATGATALSWLNVFVLNFGSGLVAPDVWQRIYSAQSAAEARRSMLRTALLVFAVQGLFMCFGLYIKANGLAADSHALAPVVLSLIPALIQPLAILIFLAAIMSTVATGIFGSAMSLCSDVAAELHWLDRKNLLPACRLMMLLTTTVGLGITFLPIDIVNLGFTCLGVTLCLAPLAVCLFFGWRVHERAAFYSLLFSVLGYALGAYFQIYTGPLALLPLLTATGTLLLFEGLARSNPQRRTHR